MNNQNNQLPSLKNDELAAYQKEQQAIANGERPEVTKMYEDIYRRKKNEADINCKIAEID